MPAAPPIARYKRELEQYLRLLVPSRSGDPLYRMVRYHLGWEDADGRPDDATGKALRPSLCLLSCEATGGDWREALPAAAAVELVHNFSLVHDDIQDRDEERHHRATVWKLWGEAQAINAGDAILALARLYVLKLADEGLPAPSALAAARLLDERTLEMVEGQTLDITFESRLEVALDEYIEMVERKSGALFDCALHLGALVGGGEAELAERLGQIGRTLGTAFQMRDDVLGIWGDEGSTGKPKGADIRRRKKSLPAVYALAEARDDTREELRTIYSKPSLSDEDVATVLRLLDESDAREHCAALASDRKETALAELDRLDLKPGPADEIKKTAEFLLERDF